jgi:hypothetical protein
VREKLPHFGHGIEEVPSQDRGKRIPEEVLDGQSDGVTQARNTENWQAESGVEATDRCNLIARVVGDDAADDKFPVR